MDLSCFPWNTITVSFLWESVYLPVHWHKEFEITLVEKGSCTYQIDLQTYKIREGDVLLLPPEMQHAI